MLLSFYKQFVDPILLGTKVHTMRNWPKRMPKIGETLHMYTGGYNDTRTLITNKEKLISTQRASVWIIGSTLTGYFTMDLHVDGRLLTSAEKNQFAVYDGFESEVAFIKYWTNNYKKQTVNVEQIIFHWTDLRY